MMKLKVLKLISQITLLHMQGNSGKVKRASNYSAINGNQLRNVYNQLVQNQMDNSQEFQPPSISCQGDENFIHPKRHQIYPSGEKNGKWSQEENTKYIVYIQHHREKMKSKERRRANKFYREMSKFIKSRNALQCRSHHQKLEDRFLYPNKIIANYKQHNDLVLYHQMKQQLQQFQNKSQAATTPYLKLQQPEQQIAIQTELAGMDTQYIHLPTNLSINPIHRYYGYDQISFMSTYAYIPVTSNEEYVKLIQQFFSYCNCLPQ